MTELLKSEIMPTVLVPICNRLADEGIPVRAIARSLRQTPDAVREEIKTAIRTGTIAYQPKDDWPPGASRDTRNPAWVKDTAAQEQELVFSCVRLFKVTKLQGALLAVLVNRPEVTKTMMHDVIESRRSALKEETDPKMIDVVICNLRRRVKPFNIVIHTLWGRGYFMEPAMRKHVSDMVSQYISGALTTEEVQAVMPPESKCLPHSLTRA